MESMTLISITILLAIVAYGLYSESRHCKMCGFRYGYHQAGCPNDKKKSNESNSC